MAEETRVDPALGDPPRSPPSKAVSGGPSGSAPKAFRSLVTVAALVVIIAGLKLAGAVLVPFLMAVFLSALATPIVLWLEQRGLPPGWSVSVTMIAVLGTMVAAGALVTGSIAGFDEALPGYRAALDVAFHELVGHLAGYGIDVEQAMSDQALEPGMVLGMAGSFVGNVLAALSNTTLVLLTMVFFLLEVAGFPAKLRAALGDPQADLSEFTEIMAEVQRYLVIKTAVSAVTGACVALLLAAVGVDFAVLWGLVAFLLNFIPNIGSIIAAVPAMAVALVQPGLGIFAMLVVGLGYLVINMIIGNIIEPQLTGRRLGLSPLVVFLSLVFWGWIWGSVGMLLSVPLTIVVRIVLERNHELRWIAVLLGPSPEWERPRGAGLLGRLGLGRAAAAGQGSTPADGVRDDERG